MAEFGLTDSDQRRFLSKFRVGDDCWEWTASTRGNGYGCFWLDGRKVSAHRVAYELFIGVIPDGLELDHLCCRPSCVRPDHLEPVTHQENMWRSESFGGACHRAKTHCLQGHPYDDENTYRHGGKRHCRKCNRHAQKRYAVREAERTKIGKGAHA